MKREDIEDNFQINLEEFKSTGFEKTPPKEDSTVRTAADWNYKSYDMSVGTELM